ncbi:MAG: hypothetical protein ABFD77_02145 [Thermotogota bacterium]
MDRTQAMMAFAQKMKEAFEGAVETHESRPNEIRGKIRPRLVAEVAAAEQGLGFTVVDALAGVHLGTAVMLLDETYLDEKFTTKEFVTVLLRGLSSVIKSVEHLLPGPKEGTAAVLGSKVAATFFHDKKSAETDSLYVRVTCVCARISR